MFLNGFKIISNFIKCNYFIALLLKKSVIFQELLRFLKDTVCVGKKFLNNKRRFHKTYRSFSSLLRRSYKVLCEFLKSFKFFKDSIKNRAGCGARNAVFPVFSLRWSLYFFF